MLKKFCSLKNMYSRETVLYYKDQYYRNISYISFVTYVMLLAISNFNLTIPCTFQSYNTSLYGRYKKDPDFHIPSILPSLISVTMRLRGLQSRKAAFRFLKLLLPEKLKNSIFEMPIIAQTLHINNLRTTSTKSINLHTIRKLIEYSLKAMFTLTVFRILLFKGRLVLSPAQRGTGSERVTRNSG